MKNDKNGTSTCPPGEEKFEIGRIPGRVGLTYVQYDFRHPDGELFSTTARTLTMAREKRDKWLDKKHGKSPIASDSVKKLMDQACAEIQQLTQDRDNFYQILVRFMHNGSVMRLSYRSETVRGIFNESCEKIKEYENRSKRASACKKSGQKQGVHNLKARSK